MVPDYYRVIFFPEHIVYKIGIAQYEVVAEEPIH